MAQANESTPALPTDSEIESRIGFRLPAGGGDAIRALMVEYSDAMAALAATESVAQKLRRLTWAESWAMAGKIATLTAPAQQEPELAPKEAGNRVLVIVSGGVADPISDTGLDVEVFDWDNYNADPDGTGGVPERFADLAQQSGVPVGEATAPIDRPR
jgi:hypothetical protein